MAADMICAYYDREACSRELFAERLLAGKEHSQSGTKDPEWDRYLGKFDVIRIVMTDFIKRATGVSSGLDKLTGRILDELGDAYPEVSKTN